MIGIRGLYLSGACVAMIATATTAHAQSEQPKKDVTTGEIVVTAQFRSQKLQDTPDRKSVV